MAGEGTEYIKRKAQKEAQSLIQKLAQQGNQDEVQIGKMNDDRTQATMPDGTIRVVTPVGFVGDYARIMGNIAFGSEPIVASASKKPVIAYIMERVPESVASSKLAIRKLGSSTKYIVPKSLNEDVVSDYVGGFTSDGKNFFIAGAWDEDGGQNTFVHWKIYKNFTFVPDEGSGASVTSTDIQEGIVNLNVKFQENVATGVENFRAPQNAWVEEETPGLAGRLRGKYLYPFYGNDGDTPDPPTPEEIQEFIDELQEYFELTDEEIDDLFPPETLGVLVLNFLFARDKKFRPTYFIEFHNDILPLTFDFNALFGTVCTSTVAYDGFRSQEWVADTQFMPVFMDINFAFNNDEDGNPILDVITSYQTTCVYSISDFSWEHTVYNLDELSGPQANTTIETYYSKAEEESYTYTLPNNTAYDGDQTISFAITNPPDGTSRHNMRYRTEGTRVDGITPLGGGVPRTQVGWTEYYTDLWFDLYTPSLPSPLPRCDVWTTNPFLGHGPEVNDPDCPYFPYSISDSLGAISWGGADPGCDQAFISFFGGEPYLFVAANYYPPDTGFYRLTFFDGTQITNPSLGGGVTYYPTSGPPFPFITYYPWYYEPHFGGYFLQEDNYVWGQANPQALVIQFGRGVMTVKQVNSSNENDITIAYIDRPPASPNDYDHLYNPYFGVNGSRAIVTKNDTYDAYAYSPEYVETTNQIIGTEAPDTYTDVYFINKGTWPFPFTFLKAIDSRDFVQYLAADVTQADGSVVSKEYVKHVNVQVVQGQTVTKVDKLKVGSMPDDAGDVLDIVIKGINIVED